MNILSDKALADIVRDRLKEASPCLAGVQLVLDGKVLRDSLLKLKREKGED